MHCSARKILFIASLITTPFAGNGQAVPHMVPPFPTPQPYTAEFKVTTVRTLSDGTTITRESRQIQARDSQSRHFQQTINLPPSADPSEDPITVVRDGNAGTVARWQSRTRRIDLQRIPSRDQRTGCWQIDTGSSAAFESPGQRPNDGAEASVSKPQIEELGTTVIEGFEVHGRRITIAVPAGDAGSDQPMVITTESWTAPALSNLQLKATSENPRSGKTTTELVSIKQGEPDPALFQPPKDYQVVVHEMHQVPCK